MSNKEDDIKKPTIDQDKLLSFAMGELAKVFEDLKQGKAPSMSSNLEMLQDELSKANAKMTDDELAEWVKNLNVKIDGDKK